MTMGIESIGGWHHETVYARNALDLLGGTKWEHTRESTITMVWRSTYSINGKRHLTWVMTVGREHVVLQYNPNIDRHEPILTFPSLDAAKAYCLVTDN